LELKFKGSKKLNFVKIIFIALYPKILINF